MEGERRDSEQEGSKGGKERGKGKLREGREE